MNGLLRIKGLTIMITPYADGFGKAFEAGVAFATAESKQNGFASIQQAWRWCEAQAPKIMALAP